ncbi:hypothetical protein QTP81_16950 [Alteromonas sp. ASW11-36]|uniref:DUF3426 domain-containing protein n=1 Tax=Alteromonas arenosi TaxID=3055817 RepID=A0ABT7T1H5_9ALTE|nr:hypothetical protein [Alteromonas sp. ASW11-36]MDM7862298.1 hypothetical protein [Alteromonas sp. ASW11-36]
MASEPAEEQKIAGQVTQPVLTAEEVVTNKHVILGIMLTVFVGLAIWTQHDGSNDSVDVSYAPPLCTSEQCRFEVVLKNKRPMSIAGKAIIRSMYVAHSKTGSELIEIYERHFEFEIDAMSEFSLKDSVNGVSNLPNFKVYIRLNEGK